MNKQNIQILIDHLKTQKFCGFNMEYFVSNLHDASFDHSSNHCGTTACLAGHIRILQENPDCLVDFEFVGDKFRGPEDYVTHGAEFLGISWDDAADLFMYESFICGRDLDGITLEQAIAVLENLKTTGKVEWEKVLNS